MSTIFQVPPTADRSGIHFRSEAPCRTCGKHERITQELDTGTITSMCIPCRNARRRRNQGRD